MHNIYGRLINGAYTGGIRGKDRYILKSGTISIGTCIIAIAEKQYNNGKKIVAAEFHLNKYRPFIRIISLIGHNF